VTTSIDLDQSFSNTIQAGLPFDYLGEPYDSDYASAYRTYQLTESLTTDARIELQWSGTSEMGLWLVDGLTFTPAVVTGSGSAAVTVRAGQRPIIVVGSTAYPAPTKPVPFTITARMPGTSAQ
jgi:hypothetical protein